MNPLLLRKLARTMGACAVVALLCTPPAEEALAQESVASSKALGLGVQLGEPSGITAKLYTQPETAYELIAAWDLHDFFFLNGHVLFERPIPRSPLRYYLGPGLLTGLGKDKSGRIPMIGVSGEAGVNFLVGQYEAFVHVTPRFHLIPATKAHFGGGIGLRYYLPNR